MTLVSIGLVAKQYGVSVSTIRRWVAKGLCSVAPVLSAGTAGLSKMMIRLKNRMTAVMSVTPGCRLMIRKKTLGGRLRLSTVAFGR